MSFYQSSSVAPDRLICRVADRTKGRRAFNGGNPVLLVVPRPSTWAEIRARIQEDTGLPTGSYQLKPWRSFDEFDGTEGIADLVDVVHRPVPQLSLCYQPPKPSGKMQSICVRWWQPCGVPDRVQIDCHPDASLEDLKHQIYGRTWVSVDDQILKLGNTFLTDDNRTLSSLGITEVFGCYNSEPWREANERSCRVQF